MECSAVECSAMECSVVPYIEVQIEGMEGGEGKKKGHKECQ